MRDTRYGTTHNAQTARIGANDSVTPGGLVGYLGLLAVVVGLLTVPSAVLVLGALTLAGAFVWTSRPTLASAQSARGRSETVESGRVGSAR